MSDDFTIGRFFGIGICDHFGLDSAKVSDVMVNSGIDEVFTVTLKISLTAADLRGIAAAMDAVNGKHLAAPS